MAVPTLPSSIRKRDGRVVPFELEKLSRSLFAATESLGCSNAFLARELAESVVHFLRSEIETESTTTEHLAQVAIKVLRELGHPSLALAFEETVQCRNQLKRKRRSTRLSEPATPMGDPFAVLLATARTGLRAFSLSSVYPRDLVSAHEDGLLRLLDLDVPNELLGAVFPPQQPPPLDGWQLLEMLTRVRQTAGLIVAFDGPEHAIAVREGIPEEMAGAFHANLERSLRLTHLQGILNLNVAEPPIWAARLNLGPLFQDFQREMENERLDRIAIFLLRRARDQTIFWHLSERDFREESIPRLKEIAKRTSARNGVEFVFDRPRRPIVLGPGIDRENPALLGAVAINLPRFADQMGGGPLDRTAFLKNLASLARFARSAGYARADYLRKAGRPPLHEGFMLERAIHIVAPIGAMEASRKVLGGNGELAAIVELSAQMMETIREALEADRLRTIATRIDSLPGFAPDGKDGDVGQGVVEEALLPSQQLRYAAAQHSNSTGGSVVVRLERPTSADASDLPDLLRAAWRGNLSRLRVHWDD